MNNNIIPFEAGAKLPAYLANRPKTAIMSAINADVVSAATFPVLSIKGKQFTLVKDGIKKIMTRADDPDEVLQSLNLGVARVNTKSRVFYAKAYVEGESDGAKPTCYSGDGAAPDTGAMDPQAKKCALCPHAVWGSTENGKGTACSVNTRLAVVDPNTPDEPLLLRVPAASRKNFADAAKTAVSRGLDYNMLVYRVSFDREAATPKLVFKPVGFLEDAAYATVAGQYDTELVREIVGLPPLQGEDTAAAPEPEIGVDELDAAIATRAALTNAKTKPEPVKPKAAKVVKTDAEKVTDVVANPAPAVQAEVKKESKPVSGGLDELLEGLDSLLGSTDD